MRILHCVKDQEALVKQVKLYEKQGFTVNQSTGEAKYPRGNIVIKVSRCDTSGDVDRFSGQEFVWVMFDDAVVRGIPDAELRRILQWVRIPNYGEKI